MTTYDNRDRSRAGMALAWLGAHALSRSPVVHFDATASVRAAHTPEEVRGVAADAGLAGARIRRRIPFRWVLEWDRT